MRWIVKSDCEEKESDWTRLVRHHEEHISVANSLRAAAAATAERNQKGGPQVVDRQRPSRGCKFPTRVDIDRLGSQRREGRHGEGEHHPLPRCYYPIPSLHSSLPGDKVTKKKKRKENGHPSISIVSITAAYFHLRLRHFK